MNRTRLESHPLAQIDVAAAAAMQFRLVDAIRRRIDGWSILSDGDRGIRPGLGRPERTAAVEAALADFFAAPAAALVRGAGTGAIRAACESLLPPRPVVLVHAAPIYPTTLATLTALGADIRTVDFHDQPALTEAARHADGAIIQHARQLLTDSYALADVIAALRRGKADLPLISDDNYVVLKVPAVGVQLGATVSTFSTFKLLGPEGIGCVVGDAAVIDAIHRRNYSGGTQVQGPEAMAVLRGMVYAPVAFALQAGVVDEVARRLAAGEVDGVAGALVASAQSRVILVEFAAPIAARVLEAAPRFGAAPQPIGAESRYELAPMFYRISGTMLQGQPELGQRLIRINPMRAGADTVLDILRRSVAAAHTSVENEA
ncbi:MAG: aminotransferase [Chloroflexota bacterium]